jgi:hypothetical protein
MNDRSMKPANGVYRLFLPRRVSRFINGDRGPSPDACELHLLAKPNVAIR